MPTLSELTAQMSQLLNSWQKYINEQIALDNGTADYLSSPVNGVAQPGAGYYPITMPVGVVPLEGFAPITGTTVWRPCIARIRADAAGHTTIIRAATSQTLQAGDSGKVVLCRNTGGTTNVTLTVPTGLGANFSSIYVMDGTQNNMTIQAASGVTLNQEEGLTRARGRHAAIVVFATASNVLNVSGVMKA